KLSATPLVSPSLMQTVDAYSEFYQQSRHMERATVRMILDALDTRFPPSVDRTAVREMVLKSIAWMRSEMERFFQQEFNAWLPPVSQETSTGPDSGSGGFMIN
ncbi:MAG: hypothetical protein WC712_15420, partial [Candidatus Brocadiia bacterium]